MSRTYRFVISMSPARSAILISALAVALPFGRVAEALPIFGGPGFSPANGGYTSVSPPLITNDGAAVGNESKTSAGSNVGDRTVRWSANGAPPQELATLGVELSGFTQTVARVINPGGTIAGYSRKYDLAGTYLGDRAVRWAPNATAIAELGTLGTDSAGYTRSYAYGIDAGGAIFGSSNKYDTASNYLGSRPVRWSAGATAPTELAVLSTNTVGFSYGEADSVDGNGTIVGISGKFDSSGTSLGVRAVRWAAGSTVPTELGTLRSDSVGYNDSRVIAVNTGGTIIGSSRKNDASGNYLGESAVRWDANSTTAIELGTLETPTGGSSNSSANALNAAGTIVGSSCKYGTSGTNTLGTRAVRWNANSTVATELGTLWASPTTYDEARAYAINASGWAVGADGYYDLYNPSPATSPRAVAWGENSVAIDLNSLLPTNSGWMRLTYAWAVTDTGWIGGEGLYDPDGPGVGQAQYPRDFIMLLPQAGTYGRGDANFDTHIDFADLLLVAQNYGKANASLDVHVADFNLDGQTNFADLLALAQHFGSGPALSVSDGVSLDFVSDWAFAQSLVPEPVTPTALLCASTFIVQRRRRS